MLRSSCSLLTFISGSWTLLTRLPSRMPINFISTELVPLLSLLPSGHLAGSWLHIYSHWCRSRTSCAGQECINNRRSCLLLSLVLSCLVSNTRERTDKPQNEGEGMRNKERERELQKNDPGMRRGRDKRYS